jgi:hypothetical protein
LDDLLLSEKKICHRFKKCQLVEDDEEKIRDSVCSIQIGIDVMDEDVRGGIVETEIDSTATNPNYFYSIF